VTDGAPATGWIVLGSRAETDAWRKDRGLSHSDVVQVSTRAKSGPKNLSGQWIVVELPSWMLASAEVRNVVVRDLAALPPGTLVTPARAAPQPDELPTPVPQPAGEMDLLPAVRESIDKMSWLTGSDKALKVLAMRQAAEIDLAVARASELDDLRSMSEDESVSKRLERLAAMCDVTKVVGWLGPQLQGVLKALGGTPEARKAILGKAANKGNRLAAMQEAAEGTYDAAEDDPSLQADEDD
jgi:hypothetical protein